MTRIRLFRSIVLANFKVQMRILASILCIYLFFLQLQPALLPVKMKEAPVPACCAGKHEEKKNAGKDDCCNKDMCNPFFTSCPLCAASGFTVNKLVFNDYRQPYIIVAVFFSSVHDLIGRYETDILRPPQLV
jgi:hypothetical protein